MTEPIEWVNKEVTVGELDPWPRNPRQIKQDQAKRLEQSYDEFGEVETLAVGPKMANGKYPIYNGHSRYHVLLGKHGPDFKVQARVSSRPLTEKEREKLTVYLHKGAAGEWDMDVLSEWDIPDLMEWGFSEKELGLDSDPLPDFKEYTEDVENEVEYITCPECGHKWPK